MASFSQTIIIGHLGRDPETRFMASGDAAANFSVAVTESWKDKSSGEKREETTWFRVSMFGKLAEIAGQYLKKGSQVQVIGKMKERKWTDKDGNERTTWELRADQMTMLGSAGGNGGGQQGGGGGQQSGGQQRQQAPSQHQQQKQNGYQDLGDDIPF